MTWPDARSVSESDMDIHLNNVYYCFWEVQNMSTSSNSVGLLLEKVGTAKFTRVGFMSKTGYNLPDQLQSQQLEPDDYESLDGIGRYTFSII